MSPARPPIKEYVAPYAAFMAVIFAVGFVPAAFKAWSYLAQIILCGWLVIRYWRVYQFQFPKGIGFTLFTAILVLVIWVSPQVVFKRPPRLDGFDPTVFKGQPALYWAVLVVRFTRLTVITGFIEEIFWRGFLVRYLVCYPEREDFESVPMGTFTWLSFGIVSAAFCLEHQFADYPAALLTGVLFNLLYYRTRSLSACVLCHAVANFLLGIYIMRSGQWGFW